MGENKGLPPPTEMWNFGCAMTGQLHGSNASAVAQRILTKVVPVCQKSTTSFGAVVGHAISGGIHTSSF